MIMKRFLCVLLILCILPVCVFAEYTGKTDDELKADFRSIVSELISRKIWLSDSIPAGLYIVGESVPAGSYELTATQNGKVAIYPTLDDMATGHNRIIYILYSEGESFVLTLSDGLVIDLGCTCKISPLAFSW